MANEQVSPVLTQLQFCLTPTNRGFRFSVPVGVFFAFFCRCLNLFLYSVISLYLLVLLCCDESTIKAFKVVNLFHLVLI